MKTFKQFLTESSEKPDEENENYVGGKENAIKHDIPMSHMTRKEVLHKMYKSEPVTKKYHWKKIRATQKYLDKRWVKKKNAGESPYGLEDKEGNVHVIDGHHRANDAIKHKRSFYMTTTKEVD